MIEHLNIINSLSDQIMSILDLMMMCEDDVDIKSIKTASEMCMTMHLELMQEIEKIKEEYKENKIVEKLPGDYMDEMTKQNSEIIKELSPKGCPDMPKEIICNCTNEQEKIYYRETEDEFEELNIEEHNKYIRADVIEECNRKLDELERNYKSCYGVEIIEMYAEVYEDFRTWLKEQK